MGNDTRQLLAELRAEAEKWSLAEIQAALASRQGRGFPDGSLEDIREKNAVYDLEMLLELKTRDDDLFAEKFPGPYRDKIVAAIDRYMDTYAPGETELKERVRLLTLYKTLIAKKPLHPPGMVMEDGRITQKGIDYFCPAKQRYLRDKDAMCRFCVAKTREY